MQLAPIVITVYHRPDCFAKCIEALQKNILAPESELFVISDAAARDQDEPLVQQVREYARRITGFKAVHLRFREKNMGGHRSVIEAVGNVLETFDRFIFLEDDIIVARDFLEYLNDGLEYFKDNKSIFSVAAYKRAFRVPHSYEYDVFFLENYCPWGFGIWKDRYYSVDVSDFDRYSVLLRANYFKRLKKDEPFFISILKADSRGEMKALDVRFEYHIHQNRLLSVFPCVSRSMNIGHDGRGTHCGDSCGSGICQEPLSDETRKVNWDVPIIIEKQIAERFFEAAKPLLSVRIYRTIRKFGFGVAFCYYKKRFFARLGKGA